MATKTFALNTEPHEAVIGDVTLLFQPEVMGDAFLDKYEEMQDQYKHLGIDLADMTNLTSEQLRETNTAVRVFLAGLMLPESADVFVAMPLPDRIVVGLLEWALELYGGGQRPPTSSSGSSKSSPPRGTRGTGSSRSMGSTRAAGR